jgi:2'-5' RNA ligase
VWPPDDVLDAIDALPRPATPGVRYTTRPQWHVTLRFVGMADTDVAHAAFALIDGRATTAVIGPTVTRLGKTVVALHVKGLDALAVAVTSATAAVGDPPDPRPFKGHLTIARLDRRARCDTLGAVLNAHFAVREVHLVRSHLSSEKARYETIAIRPLTP